MKNPSDMEAPKNRFCEERGSSIHGRGLFARRKIRKGTKIIEYLGERVSKEESERRGLQRMEEAEKTGGGSVYVFELDDETDLDGAFDWNLARLANHSCDPNCEAVNIDGRIWLVALQTIQQDDELTFDYGYDVQFYKDHPCRCGSANCVGYIVRSSQRDELAELLEAANEPEPESHAAGN